MDPKKGEKQRDGPPTASPGDAPSSVAMETDDEEAGDWTLAFGGEEAEARGLLAPEEEGVVVVEMAELGPSKEKRPCKNNKMNVFAEREEEEPVAVRTCFPRDSNQKPCPPAQNLPEVSSEGNSSSGVIPQLKEMLKGEQTLSLNYSTRLDPLFQGLLESLEALEALEAASAELEDDLEDSDLFNLCRLKWMQKERRMLEVTPKLTPFERSHLFVVMFVLQRRLSEEMEKRSAERSNGVKEQLEEVTSTVVGFLDRMSFEVEPPLELQGDIKDCIWRLNWLKKSPVSDGEEGLDAKEVLERVALNLNILAHSHLSQTILGLQGQSWWPSHKALRGRDPSSETSTSGRSKKASGTSTPPAERDGSLSNAHLEGYVRLEAISRALLELLEEGLKARAEEGAGGEAVSDESEGLEGVGALEEFLEVLEESIELLDWDGGAPEVRRRPHRVTLDADLIFFTEYVSAKGVGEVVNAMIRINNALVHLRWLAEQDGGRPQETPEKQRPPHRVVGKGGKGIGRAGGVKGEARRRGHTLERLQMARVALDSRSRRLCYWRAKLEDQDSFEQRVKDAFRSRDGGVGRRMLSLLWVCRFPVRGLLFPRERSALKAVLSSQGRDEDIMASLQKVASPLKAPAGGRGGRRGLPRSMRYFPRPPEGGELDSLQESIKWVSKTTIPLEKLRAKDFQIFTLAFYPVLYVLDVLSDANVALNHYGRGNLLYFALTVLFILGPMIAEAASKAALKLYGTDKAMEWWEVLKWESVRLLPRSLKSLNYALNSRLDFDRDMETFYSELNRLRVEEGPPLSKGALFRARRRTPGLIQAHFYAMTISNERLLFNWKMLECLNESAPQLMLQLVIAIINYSKGQPIGAESILGIATSLASLSWTMHLCHYYMHFDGLSNNFKMLDRLLDFLAHFLIIGSRFFAISLVASLHPKIFMMASSVYLALRCVYLVYFSATSWTYRLISKNQTMLLWPLHRLFITPYVLRLWRCDCGDDILFHLETFVLALSWPYVSSSEEHPSPEGLLNRWAFAAGILSTNFLLLPFLLHLNKARHEESRFCREDDPFWLGKYLGNASISTNTNVPKRKTTGK